MKVLSIDLDFISAPAINSLQDFDTNTAEPWFNPRMKWENIFEADSQQAKSNTKFSIQNFQFCLKTFIRALKHCDDVHFAYDHDGILYGLEGHTDIEVINIDHHSDILSNSGDFGNWKNEKKYCADGYVTEGNWGYYLQSQGKLKSWTWIVNPSSEEYLDYKQGELLLNNFTHATIDQYKFEDYNFDQVFVCLSPDYIPPYHWHFLGTFLTVYEEMTGNKVDLEKLHKKYEYKVLYKSITDYILPK